MPSSSSSSRASWGSPSLCRLRRFSRLLFSGILLVLAVSYAFRSTAAASLRFFVLDTPQTRQATLARMHAAKRLFPLDHYTRASVASYYATTRLYDDHVLAIGAIEEELRHDPFNGGFHLALISYYLAANNEAAALNTVQRLQKFRPGLAVENY